MGMRKDMKINLIRAIRKIKYSSTIVKEVWEKVKVTLKYETSKRKK